MERKDYKLSGLYTETSARRIAETLNNPSQGFHAKAYWYKGNQWIVRVVVNPRNEKE